MLDANLKLERTAKETTQIDAVASKAQAHRNNQLMYFHYLSLLQL